MIVAVKLNGFNTLGFGSVEMSKVSELVSERKWASKHLEEVLKKEAFMNTLKANLQNLTTDIKVGTRFISTKDYDGTLYECKQEPYVDYLTKPVYRRNFENDKLVYVSGSSRVLPHTLSIAWYWEGAVREAYGNKNYCLLYTQEKLREIEGTNLIGKTICFKDGVISQALVEAQVALAKQLYDMREEEDEPYPSLLTDPRIKNIRFTISEMETDVEQTYYIDEQGQRQYGSVLTVKATGYFPDLERMTTRIWVRKCNLVALALGKNIDSSKKCINFTLEEMSLREMLFDEMIKIEKVRKIFNKNNPEKCRSVRLKDLKEEHERMKPSLERIELLWSDLYNKDVKVPAYYCEKYGFLIPLKGQILVDLSGNTVEQDILKKNEDARNKIDETINLRKQVVEEVLPVALHPTRVEREMEKYGIEGVFGDDKTVVSKWVDGKLTEGVVNHSVLG